MFLTYHLECSKIGVMTDIDEFLAELQADEKLEKECPFRTKTPKEVVKALEEFYGIKNENE